MAHEVSLFSSTVVVRSQEQVSSELDGKVVLLSIANGEYYHMDVVGSRVWGLLAEPRTFGALIAQLVTEFEVEPEQCERDVRPFLERLLRAGLVHATPAADAAR